MKKNNLGKSFIYIALSASLFMGSGLNAFATDNENTMVKEFEFQTSNQYDDGSEHFETSIEQDGKTYLISSITTEVLNEETVEGEHIIYDSPAFIDADKVEKPQESIEQGGKTYLLKDMELQSARIEDRTQYVESEVVLNGVEWLDNVPETSEIEVVDNATGQEITTTMPFIKVQSQNEKWVDTFKFPITISNYDADYFMLGDTKVSKSDNLVDYKDEFLSYLGLPANKYKISTIDWNGDAYTKNGVLYRTATAFGQKLTYDIVAIYGGEAALPAADGQRYHCRYVNAEMPDSKVYTIKATAHYTHTPSQVEDQGFLQNLIEWLKANPIAAFGIGSIILIAFVLLIIFLMSKKKDKNEEDKNRVDIIDIK
jgi:hypothetical protein